MLKIRNLLVNAGNIGKSIDLNPYPFYHLNDNKFDYLGGVIN